MPDVNEGNHQTDVIQAEKFDRHISWINEREGANISLKLTVAVS